jgi:hypothetical protein
VQGTLTQYADTSLSSDGSTLFAGVRAKRGRVGISGTGSLSAQPTAIFSGSYGGVILDSLDRSTESGDIRITESGDVRITYSFDPEVSRGNLISEATIVPFESETYLNVEDVWKLSYPWVKYEGEWQQPVAMYKNVIGSWKRVN